MEFGGIAPSFSLSQKIKHSTHQYEHGQQPCPDPRLKDIANGFTARENDQQCGNEKKVKI